MNDFVQAFLRIFGFSLIRYFFVAGLFFLWFYVFFRKSFSANKIQNNKITRKRLLREILNSTLTTVVLALIGLLLLYTPVKFYTRVYDNLGQHTIWWFFISICCALIIHDTYFYWMHYFLHHPRLFKEIHLIHNRSSNPSPFSSYSFHVIEAFLEGAVLILIVMILPIHPFAIALFVLSAFVINVYGHLGYEVAPIWFRKTFLFQLINTSVYHNLHHSKFKGNYGLYFRFWDKIMGTEHPGYVAAYDKVQQKRLSKKSQGAGLL